VSDPHPAELFPPLLGPLRPDQPRISVCGDTLSAAELAAAAADVAAQLRGARCAAVYATSSNETIAGVLGGISAGVPIVLINPGAGGPELQHVIADSDPQIVIAARDAALPAPLTSLPRIAPTGAGGHYRDPFADDPERIALIVYTSGTTGLPKGVRISRRAIASNLDALAAAWEWTAADRVVHSLPLFHIHGLVVGSLGPLRVGCGFEHLGRFSPESTTAAVAAGATMVFGVPTMYHRLADACDLDPEAGEALGRARLLVSGSAPLPAVEHRRIERLSGQRVVERYGMTETLINTSTRAHGDRAPGTVGTPLAGVQLRLLDDDAVPLRDDDAETIGEIAVRGPSLFTDYLNRPQATASAFRDGWFLTGDLATCAADGTIRIVGRRSTDLLKSGGFKIGAGEIEGVLLEHPSVAEAAVVGEPDDDLGERVVAWVVIRDVAPTSPDELISHAAGLLAAHKRPREVRFVTELPRNTMGKVIKRALLERAPRTEDSDD
jgi:malonyl-CoA/methylmalonyl-CoA synthetase